MKNLFLALLLTGFVGAASVNTVSASTHSKVTVGGEECKKGKKCKKKNATCCQPTSTTANDSKKNCSADQPKKCCSSHSSSTSAVPTPAVPVKTDAKKTETVK